jgi:hypothetical protein
MLVGMRLCAVLQLQHQGRLVPGSVQDRTASGRWTVGNTPAYHQALTQASILFIWSAAEVQLQPMHQTYVSQCLHITDMAHTAAVQR